MLTRVCTVAPGEATIKRVCVKMTRRMHLRYAAVGGAIQRALWHNSVCMAYMPLVSLGTWTCVSCMGAADIASYPHNDGGAGHYGGRDSVVFLFQTKM